MMIRAAVLSLLLTAGSASAADSCPRGALDAKYCDRDGDMVADLPTDAKQILDPKEIIFSYTPLEDPSVYVGVWDGFLRHMEKVTGRRVRFFQVQSYAAQLEALRSGRLHVAGVNTGSVPVAVNCGGFVPFTMMAWNDGSYGYEMEIIVPAKSPIRTPPDLKGSTIAFSAPTSNSGYKAPAAILESEFKLVEGRDYKSTFSGKHDTTVLGIANGDYEAGAIANVTMKQMAERKVFDTKDVRSIYRSQTFPTTGYGYAYNLAPALVAKIKEAFATFTWAGSGLEKEFAEEKFIPITYQKDWEVIRKVDAAMKIAYDCK
ncbi:MAG: phosphate/phosphite/phosphonate ABC transporter substrate-binding protein [Rhodospirillaceae bacterium]